MSVRHMAIKLEHDKGQQGKYLQDDVFTSNGLYVYRTLLPYRCYDRRRFMEIKM